MTTTPGGTPGSSDSSEPDNGDSPTTPPPSASTAPPVTSATAPRIPEPSAPGDSAPAAAHSAEPEDAHPQDTHRQDTAPQDARPEETRSADAREDDQQADGSQTDDRLADAQKDGEQSDSAQNDGARDAEQRAESGTEQQGAAIPPGWAQHQPPPATEGWARWTPPQGSRPRTTQPPNPRNAPYQGGPRWGPAAGGQPAPGGPGPAGGWQPHMGWGVRAPEPKPGVVPLRPLGAGEILGGAMATLRLHWPRVIGYTLVVGAVTEAASAVLQHRFSDTSRLNDLENDPQASASDVAHALGGSMLASGLALLVTMFGSVIVSALIATVVSRAVLGRQITSAELGRDIRSRLPQLLGLALLMPLLLCLTVGLGALPGIIIALLGAGEAGAALGILGGIGGAIVMMWLFIQLSLTPAALMLEKGSVTEAVKRSWKLVGGAWWRVLGVQLLAVLVATIVTSVIELPFMFIGDAASGSDSGGFLDANAPLTWTYLTYVGVGGTIAAALTLPITAGTTTLLYLDQRIRRESLDIELIRASRDNG